VKYKGKKKGRKEERKRGRDGVERKKRSIEMREAEVQVGV
jgi:hypothetical protein